MPKMRGLSFGILGASSLVGNSVVSLLAENQSQITAFSRRSNATAEGNFEWKKLPSASFGTDLEVGEAIEYWCSVAPIWVLPEYFSMLEAYGARRIVALSSTSRYSKQNSDDLGERAVAQRLVRGEEKLKDWAKRTGIAWTILRPTMIYGQGRDQNVSQIAEFIRRFGFFPVCGEAKGLRQPIHLEDVAATCVAALQKPLAENCAYNIAGREILTYKEMVARVFHALDCPPRIVSIPVDVFRLIITGVRFIPRYRRWTAAMALRMNQDLVFDCSAASHDLGIVARSFTLAPQDVAKY